MDSSGTPEGRVSTSSTCSCLVFGGDLTFGFRNTQNGVHDHDDASAAENQECAVCDLGQHDRCELRNHEVEQPLGHQGSCHCEGANVVRLCLSVYSSVNDKIR